MTLGIANGLWLIGIGLVLIAVCHLPVSFRIRGVILLVLGALLITQRASFVATPWSEAIWPILGWGVGLAFDALSLRDGGPPTLAQIEAEAERLRRRDERRGGVGVDGPSSGPALGPGGSTPPAGPSTAGPWEMTPGPQDGR
jgi:hypothetical protein